MTKHLPTAWPTRERVDYDIPNMKPQTLPEGYKRCTLCFGRKTFVSMGHMGEHDCGQCNGLGITSSPVPARDAEAERTCEPARVKRAYRKRAATLDLGVEG